MPCLASHGLPLANNPSPSPFHRLKILRQEAAETANPIYQAQKINLKPGPGPRHSLQDFSAPMWESSSIFQSSWPKLTQVMTISNHINSKLFIYNRYYTTIFQGFTSGENAWPSRSWTARHVGRAKAGRTANPGSKGWFWIMAVGGIKKCQGLVDMSHREITDIKKCVCQGRKFTLSGKYLQSLPKDSVMVRWRGAR
jgi:hypothetical protein